MESGIFGIIHSVNSENDPVIFQALTSPGEVIFSNVLINNRVPYWGGMKKKISRIRGLIFQESGSKGKKTSRARKFLVLIRMQDTPSS